MFQKVYSGGIWGIDGFLVSVEADIRDGLPGFVMTGNLSPETREAQERVRTALKNSGFRLPVKKITVNLSPVDIRKEGAAYDLAVSAAVLGASGLLEPAFLEDSMIVGELGLDGEVKPVRGVLSLVSAARENGLKRCFLPKMNAREGSMVEGIRIIPVESIRQLVKHLMAENGADVVPDARMDFAGNVRNAAGAETEGETKIAAEAEAYEVDFSELNGQPLLRRATEVAVAGRHNILYIGAAGTGKTMTARRIPTIMPPLTREESIEISKIYSISGLLSHDRPLVTRRPFRSPHHTITPTALAGGGVVPRPGEISLASGGVLFLDELPELSGKAIEILRQPLEDRVVTVSRLHGSCTFPANVMLAAACNPCPCGFYPDRTRCRCSPWQVKRYLGRISKPILDRIDITVEAAPVSYEEFRQKKENESSADIRKRVIRAQEIQRRRFRENKEECESGKTKNGNEDCWKEESRGNVLWKVRFNGEMGAKELEQYCRLGGKEEAYLKQIYQEMNLSVRGCHKLLKVARTIADLDGSENIEKIHISEAVSYRSLEEKFWRL